MTYMDIILDIILIYFDIWIKNQDIYGHHFDIWRSTINIYQHPQLSRVLY